MTKKFQTPLYYVSDLKEDEKNKEKLSYYIMVVIKRPVYNIVPYVLIIESEFILKIKRTDKKIKNYEFYVEFRFMPYISGRTEKKINLFITEFENYYLTKIKQTLAEIDILLFKFKYMAYGKIP